MENKYHYNYFNSINEGLNNSIYYLKNVKSEPELFFDTINNILKTLKTDRNKVYFFGNANDKTKSIINNSNAIFVDNKLPSSIEIGKLAYIKFMSNDFENTANFEPFYLKEFIGNKLNSN